MWSSKVIKDWILIFIGKLNYINYNNNMMMIVPGTVPGALGVNEFESKTILWGVEGYDSTPQTAILELLPKLT